MVSKSHLERGVSYPVESEGKESYSVIMSLLGHLVMVSFKVLLILSACPELWGLYAQ